MDLKDIKDEKDVKGDSAVADGILPPHGGYKKLLSYQKAEIVYDATVKFCADLLDKHDRTVGQMVQAARSGKQNIVEASMASGTSKEMELKLTGVARASMEELLEDYLPGLSAEKRVQRMDAWSSVRETVPRA